MTISKQRLELIKMILEDETIAAEEDEILHMLLQERISQDSISEHEGRLTLGQRAADNLAKFAGSWGFIFIFFTILTGWIVMNTAILSQPYDIYPFILLNLILSCLASIQAPVIMMSQNRQEQKDRLRAKNDYKVNLKAEIIIVDIHQKLNIIIDNQQSIAARISALEQNVNSLISIQ
ncbi:MAG: DUF1003 domain-containing protein [Bacillota bacterium]|nr:DUF1003 domain-containing protein [Bacillota bacterium]